jgi:hypothetical protein
LQAGSLGGTSNGQRSIGGGFINDAATREEFVLAAKLGMLRAYILYLVGKPSAFLIGTQNLDTFYAHSTGNDPA